MRSERVDVKISSTGGKFELRGLNTVENLSLPKQTIPKEIINRFENPERLRIEPYFNIAPSLLLGQDHCSLIVSREVRAARFGSLIASRTYLGWAIHGPVDIETTRQKNLRNSLLCTIGKNTKIGVEGDNDLHDLVKNYFNLEWLGVEPQKGVSTLEDKANRILKETTKRVENCWETGLLWKRDETSVPDSRTTALSRLKTLERKLDRDCAYAEAYCSEMERFISNGYAQKIPDEDTTRRQWYIPHFGLFNPNKERKIRLIFDAAAKSEGVSLNDQLLKGPDLLKSLIGVMMKFRERKVGIKGDIKDMFLCVKMREQDRDAQRFLWRGMDRSKPPDVYQMTTLIFGSKCSPSSAIFVKNANAEEFRETSPEAVSAIINSTYVDDFLSSEDSEEQAMQLIQEVTKINNCGGFKMHAWTSNSRRIMSQSANVQDESQLIRFKATTDDLLKEKALGLCWDVFEDHFAFSVDLGKIPNEVLTGTKKPTKREFLRVIMSVFDPLGFLAPFLIRSKILMQEVWVSGVGWDSPLNDEEYATWKVWLKDFSEIKLCKIPRCYMPLKLDVEEVQMHIFCDASPKAYAAVAYWRFSLSDGSRHVSLIGSKSRVAPLKMLSVPRLELQGAVLAARLGKLIAAEHNICVNKRFLWSDSRTVLLWVKTDPRDYQTFVSHRLAEIAELSNPLEWMWIPSEQNPADDATKRKIDALHQNHRWFNGPAFLNTDEQFWPNQDCLKSTKNLDGLALELKKTHVTLITQSIRPSLPDPKRFSKFNRLLRSVAWVLVAVSRLKHKKEPTMTVEHLEKARTLLINEIQKDCFAPEIEALKRNETIDQRSRIRTLTPILGKDGLLRVRGRVNVPAEIEFEGQPIILDGGHPITRLILKEYHEKANHGSDATVVNEIRQRFWVVNLRKSLRTTSAKCQFCRLTRAKPMLPVMADLPPARLAYQQRPFTHCGVDYFGPMLVKIGRRREKRWGALFTCLTTRAIHLELAHSANKDSAIMALRRLIARRGQPKVMYSDNGRNFVGADRELKNAQKELEFRVQEEFMVNLGIKWVFIPPDAPHFGGAWERLVRSVKTALKVTLRDQVPKEEVLVTLLAEAEHSVNSRPLTHVSMDPRDEEALTPNHFILGSSTGNSAFSRFDALQECTRKQWRIAQRFSDSFWQRWLREYLPTLLPRKKWTKETEELKLGDVVLITDYNAPRNVWKKGVVSETFPGKDKRVRVVKLRLGNNSLVRPVSKLIRLTQSL